MSGRRTRSGAVFSPWVLSQIHRSPVAISSLATQPSEPAERAMELDTVPLYDVRSSSISPIPEASGFSGTSSVQSNAFDVAQGPLEKGMPVLEASRISHDAREPQACASAFVDEVHGEPICPDGSQGSMSEVMGEGNGGEMGVQAGEDVVGLKDRLTTSRTGKQKTFTTTIETSSRKDKDKARANAHKHAKRRKLREREQLVAGVSLKHIARKRMAETSYVASPAINADTLPHTQRGYVGLPPRTTDARKTLTAQERVSTLAELIDMGFEYIPWTAESGIGILDGEERLVVGGGMPKSADWQECIARCAQTIEALRGRCRFNDGHLNHARGPFPAMAHGISYGRGQPYPMLHSHSVANAKVFELLLQDPSMSRIAGFQSHLLSCFAPDLAQQYQEVLDGILDNRSELKRNFANSNYATITVNFGPQTVSTPHVDIADLAYGLCAITALGDFNPDLGGHLVLWDLRLVIRFPPGATLLVPSAVVRHSNLPIQPGERRYSTTQYSAGHLFRWFNNGFRSDKEVQAQMDLDGITDAEYLKSQWEDGLSKLRRFK